MRVGVLALTLLATLQAGAQGEPATQYGHRAYAVADESALEAAGNYRDTGRVVRLAAPVARAFAELQAAARADGVGLVPISGFRSRAYQAGLFERAVKRLGSEERAARWVAPPGYSEHHTGRALDLGDEAEPACDVKLCFEKTRAYEWLRAHAARFGFELSFPPGRTAGPAFEPWHWRWVGDADNRTFFGDH
jgi:LAS superfamily LD-carboxypeptidase LdcB